MIFIIIFCWEILNPRMHNVPCIVLPIIYGLLFQVISSGGILLIHALPHTLQRSEDAKRRVLLVFHGWVFMPSCILLYWPVMVELTEHISPWNELVWWLQNVLLWYCKVLSRLVSWRFMAVGSLIGVVTCWALVLHSALGVSWLFAEEDLFLWWVLVFTLFRTFVVVLLVLLFLWSS